MLRLLSIGLLATTSTKAYCRQIISARKYWAKNTDELPILFFGGNHINNELPIINLEDVQEDYESCVAKQFKGLYYLMTNYPAQFYLFAGSDNYIIIDRLKDYLISLNSDKSLYIGYGETSRKIDDEDYYFHSGTGGIILTHNLLSNLLSKFTCEDLILLWKQTCLRNNINHLLAASDVALAYFLQKHFTNYEIIYNKNFYHANILGLCANDTYKYQYYEADWDKFISFHYMENGSMELLHHYLTFDKLNIDNWCLVSDAETFVPTIIVKGNKFHKLLQVIENNPHIEYFAWIAGNLTDYCYPNKAQLQRILDMRIKECSICVVNNREISYKFITGHRDNLILMCKKQYSNFRYYYGKIDDSLNNYDHLRCNVPHIINRINDYEANNRLYEDWKLSYATIDSASAIRLCINMYELCMQKSLQHEAIQWLSSTNSKLQELADFNGHLFEKELIKWKEQNKTHPLFNLF